MDSIAQVQEFASQLQAILTILRPLADLPDRLDQMTTDLASLTAKVAKLSAASTSSKAIKPPPPITLSRHRYDPTTCGSPPRSDIGPFDPMTGFPRRRPLKREGAFVLNSVAATIIQAKSVDPPTVSSRTDPLSAGHLSIIPMRHSTPGPSCSAPAPGSPLAPVPSSSSKLKHSKHSNATSHGAFASGSTATLTLGTLATGSDSETIASVCDAHNEVDTMPTAKGKGKRRARDRDDNNATVSSGPCGGHASAEDDDTSPTKKRKLLEEKAAKQSGKKPTRYNTRASSRVDRGLS
ncbi:hypothetical protein HETIRDRAFT_418447 [Heterobasidion irregulare TC 32-1]|uniref:Uncharacterized protein n=1 Tax=Heterobasidion irregulare (strain TC 32-1) TaxID=747525 RepID=W4K4Z0_HETIT|nr:uncharacterized protein HETIRDRAFT_418447 [Heterobasidion irregulare TC 32-1]ETW80435.1 hypothetical protein HETIRDRAFT_418447 [Heterobasidion irregulare TC 32-1]